jgi:hypothetical protein
LFTVVLIITGRISLFNKKIPRPISNKSTGDVLREVVGEQFSSLSSSSFSPLA